MTTLGDTVLGLRQLLVERRAAMSSAAQRAALSQSETYSAAFGRDDIDAASLADGLLQSPLFSPATLVNPEPLRILLLSCVRFGFGASFSKLQTEALCKAMAVVAAEDVRVWQRPARASFQHFQRELLALSVNRPPRSVALLSPLQSALACDHVLHCYYASYKLFKQCAARVPDPIIVQRSTAGVDEPPPPLPLSHAILVFERPPAAPEAKEEE